MRTRKWHRELLRRLPKGWRLITGGKHPKLVSPDEEKRMVVSGTSSDARGLKNTVAQLRRLGVEVK